MKCSIIGCNSSRLGQRVFLHRLYHEGKFNKDWIEAITSLNGQCIDALKTSKSFVVCEMHFERKFQLQNGPKGHLKPGAVPTIFPNILQEAKNESEIVGLGLKEIEKGSIGNSLSEYNFEKPSSRINILVNRENTDLKCSFTSDKESISKANVFIEKAQAVKNFDDQDTTTRMNDDQLLKKDNGSQISKKIKKCGVSQCSSHRNVKGISMFRIPKNVRNSPACLRKWSENLRMDKPFSKYFVVCSLHFEKHQILTPLNPNYKKARPILLQNAVPSLNLPKPKNVDIQKSKQLFERAVCVARRRRPCEVEAKDPLRLGNECESETNQCTKSMQVNLNPYFILSSFCETDEKLNALTGLDDKSMLDTLVNESLKLREDDNVCMAMKDRIILTMCKLKTNLNFAQLAILFQLNDKITADYFTDTIKHLAEIVRSLIYWPSKDEIIKSLPQSFKYFPNVRIVVKCIEISSCPRLKVLIGFAPSGLISYVSNVLSGALSNRDLFLQTDLLKLLESDDAVMIDNDFHIRDTLSNARIKIITLDGDHKQNKIATAIAHIEKRIEKLEKFKVLSEIIDASLTPFINDIVIVLCGLSNIYL